jgi:hypothetical protein
VNDREAVRQALAESQRIRETLERSGRRLTPLHWDALGLDEGGLPEHLPLGVNELGQGPENDSVAHHYECWCGDPNCPLTAALQLAWRAGWREASPE